MIDQDTAPHATAATRALDRNVLGRTAAHLYERYADVVDRETVDRIVQESYEELDRTAAVKTYLTASAGNFADHRLRSIAIARGAIESTSPRVLFVDDANAGRSQMAASLVLKHFAGLVTARSAGVEPGGRIYDTALEAMDEVGVSLEHAYPKPLSADVHEAAQFVITLACADQVQRMEGKDYRDWDIPSLEGKPLEEVRRVRDELDARVQELIREIGPDAEA
ncbi:low molecular weight phosphatase family protein [Citricoccus nitrophenolicus]|uniref:Low molecular weight phosphatase family protein n=1 Tax=Citricoccus nitrophenolicus TaxID=863575 RepID=A0ABV0IJ64_9MICC